MESDRPKEVASFLDTNRGSRPEQVCGAYIHAMTMSMIEELQTGTAKASDELSARFSPG